MASNIAAISAIVFHMQSEFIEKYHRKTATGSTKLHDICSGAPVDQILRLPKEILKEGLCLHVDSDGFFPLHYLARKEFVHQLRPYITIENLTKFGDIDAPIHWLVGRANPLEVNSILPEVTTKILQLRTKGYDRTTVLHMLAATKQLSKFSSVITTASVAMINSSKKNVGHIAARFTHLDNLLPHLTEAVLLAKDDNNRTAIHIAAASGSVFQIREILKPEWLLIGDNKKCSPIHEAMRCNHTADLFNLELPKEAEAILGQEIWRAYIGTKKGIIALKGTDKQSDLDIF